MRRILHKLVAMSGAERRLVLQAMIGVAAARLALLAFPVRRVRRMLWFLLGVNRGTRDGQRCSFEAVVHLLNVGARYSPAGSTCLSVALVAQALLRIHGYESQFRIGVKRAVDGAFAAHAWLERDGHAVIGGPDALIKDYKPLPDVEALLI